MNLSFLVQTAVSFLPHNWTWTLKVGPSSNIHENQIILLKQYFPGDKISSVPPILLGNCEHRIEILLLYVTCVPFANPFLAQMYKFYSTVKSVLMGTCKCCSWFNSVVLCHFTIYLTLQEIFSSWGVWEGFMEEVAFKLLYDRAVEGGGNGKEGIDV